MTPKFDVYDVLGVLIPGVLVVCLVPLLFPTIVNHFVNLGFPDGFAVIALLSLSVFVGHLIQSVSSLIEPVLFFTWGGSPPGKVFTSGLGERYLPQDSARRIHRMLIATLGEEATDRSLYLFAVQRAEGFGRVSKFNSLYAFHRALLTTLILSLLFVIAANCWGTAATWSWSAKLSLFGSCFLVTLLLWYRAKQRSFYYTREVLLTAERVADNGILASATRTNAFTLGEENGND